MKLLNLLVAIGFISLNASALECTAHKSICSEKKILNADGSATFLSPETASLFPGCKVNGSQGFLMRDARNNAYAICRAYGFGKLVDYSTDREIVRGVVNMTNLDGSYSMPGWVNMYTGKLTDTSGKQKVLSSITCRAR